jgi:hypothetical protein
MRHDRGFASDLVARVADQDGRDAVAAYITRGLETVEGWGIDHFLAQFFLLLDQFQKENGVTGNLMEIGVHHGRSAILLALMARPEETTIFLDLFGRQGENIDFSGRGSRAIFEGNLENWAPGRSVELIEGNSLDIDFTSIARACGSPTSTAPTTAPRCSTTSPRHGRF